jgi:hypothetical protein
VVLAPDKEAERQFLPPAHTLPRRSLSLSLDFAPTVLRKATA